jgi:hypothetical protein
MTVHWKTNIGAGELADYQFVIWPAGDNTTTPLFSATLAELNDDYFQPDSSFDGVSAWRYAMFSPDVTVAGFQSYDGLIIDLNMPYVYRNAGFMTPVFRAVSDNSTLTTVHSAHWYLQGMADYVSVALDHATYATGAPLKITITVPESSKVPSRLYNLNFKILNSSGGVVSVADLSVNPGVNTFDMTAPGSGTYQLRSAFSSELVPFYSYITDQSFIVGTGVPDTGAGGLTGSGADVPDQIVKGWAAWLDSFLQSKNLDNEAGHWLIIVVLCIITAVGLRSNPGAATGLCVLWIVGALILKWINPWFTILVAGGLGWFVYGFIKKGLHGNGSGGGEDEG